MKVIATLALGTGLFLLPYVLITLAVAGTLRLIGVL